MHWGYYFFTRRFKTRPENKQNPLLTYSKFLKDSTYFCSYFKMAIHAHTQTDSANMAVYFKIHYPEENKTRNSRPYSANLLYSLNFQTSKAQWALTAHDHF